jgi:hypothetical protein
MLSHVSTLLLPMSFMMRESFCETCCFGPHPRAALSAVDEVASPLSVGVVAPDMLVDAAV